jgi:hypothetical protein
MATLPANERASIDNDAHCSSSRTNVVVVAHLHALDGFICGRFGCLDDDRSSGVLSDGETNQRKSAPTRIFAYMLLLQNEPVQCRNRTFFLKGIKKIKFKKGSRMGEIRKMGTSRPLNGRKWTSRPTIVREAPKKFSGASSRIKKFLIREEVPEAGLPPGQWAGCLTQPSFFFSRDNESAENESKLKQVPPIKPTHVRSPTLCLSPYVFCYTFS